LFSFSKARLAKPFSPYFNIKGINAGINLPTIGNFNDIKNDSKNMDGTTKVKYKPSRILSGEISCVNNFLLGLLM
jgi:hypothetical protein